MKDTQNSRRDFIKKITLAGVAGIGISAMRSSLVANNTDSIKSLHEISDNVIHNTDGPFTLPPLTYGYEALEPHIDKMTMQIHHDKHHQAYVDNLNKALATANVSGVGLEDLCTNASKYSTAIRNNAGGHYNHSLFWTWMKPNGGGQPSGALADAINSSFGSLDNFKVKFTDAAKGRFGSGWAWLVVNNGKLDIGSTPNQDNPLMDVSDFKGTPLLGLDVWEHAYYLKYQNKRPDYITEWWNIVNWDTVSDIFTKKGK